MVPVVFLSVMAGCTTCSEGMYTKLTGADMLVHVSPHTYPPKIVSDHVDHSADALVSFGIVEFYNDN